MWIGDNPFYVHRNLNKALLQRKIPFLTAGTLELTFNSKATGVVVQQENDTNLCFSLDRSTVFQQDLNNANMTIPGCTVERSQLILGRNEGRTEEQMTRTFGNQLRHRNLVKNTDLE